MARLTPEQDAAILAEIEVERPKIRAAREKIEWQFSTLSDVGRLQALFETVVSFYSRLDSEEEAISAARHLAESVEAALTQVYRPERDAAASKQ